MIWTVNTGWCCWGFFSVPLLNEGKHSKACVCNHNGVMNVEGFYWDADILEVGSNRVSSLKLVNELQNSLLPTKKWKWGKKMKKKTFAGHRTPHIADKCNNPANVFAANRVNSHYQLSDNVKFRKKMFEVNKKQKIGSWTQLYFK